MNMKMNVQLLALAFVTIGLSLAGCHGGNHTDGKPPPYVAPPSVDPNTSVGPAPSSNPDVHQP